MPKIIHFNPDTKEMMDFISKLTEYIQTENVDNIMIAFKKKNGEVSTGFCNVDFGQRAELIGHMQVDLIDSMIQQNYVWGVKNNGYKRITRNRHMDFVSTGTIFCQNDRFI